MRAPRWLRNFNRWISNPVMIWLTRRLPTRISLLHCVGRKSGRPYVTPVVALRTQDGFKIALGYGTDTDWCLNLLAAGQGVIERQGIVSTLDEPRIRPGLLCPFLHVRIFHSSGIIPRGLHS